MGNTCKSMADSFQSMTKSTTIKKIKTKTNKTKQKKSSAVGYHSLLWGIFPAQGSDPGLPHCRHILYCLNHQGKWNYNGLLSLSNTFVPWEL